MLNIIYGAGDFGKRLYNIFKELNINIDFFCQTNKKVVGTGESIFGVDIIGLDELKEYDNINIFIAISDKNVRNDIKQMLLNIFLDKANIYDCGEFIKDSVHTPIKGDSYCVICGRNNTGFKEFGEDINIFKKYHIIGGGFRENVICPYCGSMDRTRWTYINLVKHTEIFQSECRVLHFAPQWAEELLSKAIKCNKKTEYYPADFSPILPGELKIDMTDIPFKDNYFDYIIVNHVLEHVKNDETAVQELIRVLKPTGNIILSFPICTDNVTDEDISEMTPEERTERFGQDDHMRLYGKDYKERLEKFGLKITVYSPKDVFSDSEITQYGLIKDDICLICKI